MGDPLDRFQPNEELRRTKAIIKEWCAKLGDGATVSWVEAEQQTGLPMTTKNRQLVKQVLKRLHRHYESISGYGFRTSSPDNGMTIVDSSTRRIGNALTNARQVTHDIAGRHLDQMSPDAKARLIQRRALLDTLDLSASLAKKLPK